MNFSWYGLIVGIAFVTTLWAAEAILTKEKPTWRLSSRSFALLIFLVGIGALVGARLYHLATDWRLYVGQPWWMWLAVWRGGLGIFGAILGSLVGIGGWKRWTKPELTWLEIMDVAAISLPWGQAIGRWGNFFNQELFGPPTKLPWGIFIDPVHRPAMWAHYTHFHPLFAYESIGMIFIGLNLLFLWRHSASLRKIWPFFRIGGGLYLGLYGLALGILRFNVDFGRWQSTAAWGGLTVAQWVSIGIMVLSIGWLGWLSQKKITRTAISIVVIFGGLLFLFPTIVRAQERTPFDLSLSPSVVEIRVQPGKSVTQAFLLENAGSNDLEATVTLRDFVADNLSGRPVIKDQSTFPYASLQNADRQLDKPFLLPANSSQQLVLAIQPPLDAENQDWYSALVIQTKTKNELSLGTHTEGQTRGNIVANLIVAISPTDTAPHTWRLTFPHLPRFIDSLQTLTLHPTVENTASTFGTPDLKLLILNWQHNIVYEASGLPDRVLAHSRREMAAAITRQDDPRSLDAAEFTFHPFLAIGPYTVRGTIRNNADAPLVVEQTFYAFPFSLVGGSVFCLVLILTLRILRKRRLLKQADK